MVIKTMVCVVLGNEGFSMLLIDACARLQCWRCWRSGRLDETVPSRVTPHEVSHPPPVVGLTQLPHHLRLSGSGASPPAPLVRDLRAGTAYEERVR